MPASASPFGLKIVKTQGGAITQAPERIILIAGNGSTTYPTVGLLYIPSSNTTTASTTANPGTTAAGSSIYAGDPVYLDGSGGIAQTAAGNSATNGFIIGSFHGVEYSDSSGKRTVSNKWIGGTGVQPGSEVWFWFTAATTADTIFEIQTNGSLTAGAIGQIFAVAYTGTPNAVTGFSVATLDATTVAVAGQAGLQVYGLAYDMNLGTTLPNNGYAPGVPTAGNNNWGDAYVNVYVKLAKAQFTANTTAF